MKKQVYISSLSGNIFEPVSESCLGTVRLERIGYVFKGEIVEREGIPAYESKDWIDSAVRCGMLVPFTMLGEEAL